MVIKSFFKAAFRQGKRKIENYVNDGAAFTKTATRDIKRKTKSQYGHVKSAFNRYEAAGIEKDRIFNKRYPLELKGYKKVNIYKKGSTQLKWAIDRAKRDGFEAVGIGTKDYIVLFTKKAKTLKVKKAKTVRKTAVKTRKVAVSKRVTISSRVIPVSTWYRRGIKIVRGLPAVQFFTNEKYTFRERFDIDSEEFIAKDEAKYLQGRGYKVKLVLMENLEGDERLVLYTRKG